ncbi:hypothetical protein LMG1864_03018 [Achromobacter ruhlandii]|nr:hypothetical protein LMG1864_03018 [Achromobacter ruhlandii]
MLRKAGRPALDWYVTWSPWLAAFFAPFCVAFVIGRISTEGHAFFTSSVTMQWAGVFGTIAAAVAAVGVAVYLQFCNRSDARREGAFQIAASFSFLEAAIVYVQAVGDTLNDPRAPALIQKDPKAAAVAFAQKLTATLQHLEKIPLDRVAKYSPRLCAHITISIDLLRITLHAEPSAEVLDTSTECVKYVSEQLAAAKHLATDARNEHVYSHLKDAQTRSLIGIIRQAAAEEAAKASKANNATPTHQ